jgi:hypothetical protein
MDMDTLLKGLFNAFDTRPLQPGDPVYVDCQAVRGDGNIEQELGKEIRNSNLLTCSLYAGYRGSGKTTELLRLKQYLENNGCFVVYFAADEEDISVQDAEYTDILLACTRHLLAQLKGVDANPIGQWLGSRLTELQEILGSDIKIENLQISSQIHLLARLTANVRTEPSQRHKIRAKLNPHTETLITALNQFIANAEGNLPDAKTKLVVIADNLDRITFNIDPDKGRSNHEEIFLDHSEQLKALKCHLIYTVPISMIYSKWANQLTDSYGPPQVLPSVMLQNPDGTEHGLGIEKLKDTLRKRVEAVAPGLDLATEVFESEAVLHKLCGMSGGYMRELIQMMRQCVLRTENLPIVAKVVNRTIGEFRDSYRRGVEQKNWADLAQIHRKSSIENLNSHRDLLFNRYVLEYRWVDDEGNKQTWHDVHPLIHKIESFQAALAEFDQGS